MLTIIGMLLEAFTNWRAGELWVGLGILDFVGIITTAILISDLIK